MAKNYDGNKSGASEEEGLINQQVVPQLDRRYQAPQGREDRHEANYDNDATGWVRGEGGDATKKPGFDKHRSGT